MGNNHIEMGARLEKYIKSSFLTQKAFADCSGIGKSFTSLMVSGKNPIPIELMKRLAITKPSLNLHWLLTGEGDMFFEEKNSVAPTARATSLNAADEKSLLLLHEMLLEILATQKLTNKELASKDSEIRNLKNRLAKLEKQDGAGGMD